jgi:L-seryl-tRNA(Ser) seleniumtransferase
VGSIYAKIPAVSRLLEEDILLEARNLFGHDRIVAACRTEIEELRTRIAAAKIKEEDLAELCSHLPDLVVSRLKRESQAAYTPVVNATGILIHTNLGRSPLPPSFPNSLAGYLALEYDITTGQRGQRLAPIRNRLSDLVGAESAVLVNNNASALVLLLAAHAAKREVIVSRSELIEIGGSFRLPMVMAASGAELVEVGCTNRTHLRDYEQAISDNTAAILVAHQSNFRIVGFTTSPETAELANLAHANDIPLFVDQGSGCIHDLTRWGLPREETVTQLVDAGSDVVCFSGDKLLGGPQAGILVGSKRWIEPLGKHPLYRALRLDKTALTTLDQIILAHASGRFDLIPLYSMLETSIETLQRRARSIAKRLRARGIPARGRSTRAALGGGTTPAETMPSYGFSFEGDQRLSDQLRETDPVVVARIERNELVFDVRTVFPHQDRTLIEAIATAYGVPQSRQAGGR